LYMQQRYYEPVAGRFLSVDPVTTDAKTGSSFNRYVYANNNPYKYIDPDGRFGVSFEVCLGWCAGIAIGYNRASTELAVTANVGAGLGGGATIDLRPNENGRAGSTESDNSHGVSGVVYSKIGGEIGTPIGTAALAAKTFSGADSSIEGAIGGLSKEVGLGKPDKIGIKATASGGVEGSGYVNVSKAIGSVKAAAESAVKQTGIAFQGVFRVSGRIESRALDKQLGGK
jgi:hypothetical protein